MDPAWKGKPREDVRRPATWRWIAFVTLCLMVVSLWVPAVPSEPDADASPFSPTSLSFLVALAVLAVLVVPARWRLRLLLLGLLLGTTLLAWSLADPLREVLGPPWQAAE